MKELATLAIIVGNALTFWVATQNHWPLALLLWPFWLQSVVIGAYAFRRLMMLQRFSTEGVTYDDEPVVADEASKRKLAVFFAVTYGVVHVFMFAALLFVTQVERFGGPPRGHDWLYIVGLGIAFWASHHSSHRLNVAADIRHEHNIGALMMLPYIRIVPMHVLFLSGLAMKEPGSTMLLFVGLKTVADVLMHGVEHHWLQGSSLRLPLTFSFGTKGSD
ncbi:MAG TPA: DUF6498-containing protein [Xanthomonadales bacterium]|nr:DUF6498-containing protein [Xanthomonadales bacterium]